ncbi:transporter substrate-binding domain-containing protein [uncultured Aquitalea sp.]|uniref:ATP-binding protein n=1 Tax=uncultured Aquitalea sp. TaxID=540272 RepID=UPI0025F959AD|nr:transporter substrate-binding domain-containing protein [uncultured Aquitalea sp.]
MSVHARYHFFPSQALGFFCLLFSLCVSLGAHAGAALLSADERAWLGAHPVVTVGVVADDTPPYVIADRGGDLSGITIDYLQEMGRLLGVRLPPRVYPDRASLRAALAQGEVQAADLPPDTGDFRFTQSFDDSRYVQLGRMKDRGAFSLRKTLAFSTGSLDPGQAAKLYPDWVLKPYATPLQALQAVSFGDADAAVELLVTANYLISHFQLRNLEVTRFAEPGAAARKLAVLPANGILLGVLNKAILSARDDGFGEVAYSWKAIIGPPFNFPAKLDLTEEEENWIRQHPVVRYSELYDLTPFIFKSPEGGPAGILPDLLEELSEKTGLRFEGVLRHSRQEVIDDLKKRSAVLIPYIYNVPGEADRLMLTTPFANTLWVIVSDKRIPYRNVESLRGRRIAMTAAPLRMCQTLRGKDFATLVEVSSVSKAFELLAAGKVDAAVADNTIANYEIGQNYPDQLTITGAALSRPIQLVMGVSKNELVLAGIMDKAIGSIRADHYDLVQQKWLMRSHPEYRFFRYQTEIIVSLTVLGLLIMVSFGWSVLLKRQVRLREASEARLRDELAFQSAFLNSSPTPSFVSDAVGSLISYNPAFRAFFQLRDEASSVSMAGIDARFAPFFREITETVRTVASSRQLSFSEVAVPLAEGGEVSVYLWVGPFYSARGELAGVLGGWVDISYKTLLEKELREARDVAEQANRAKSFFVSTISHEIRTPINVIIGMLELQRLNRQLPVSTVEELGVANDSAQHLLVLIDDILDLSKIEAEKMELHPEPVRLADKLGKLDRMFRAMAKQQGIAFEVTLDGVLPDVWVSVDPVRLLQVLSNLLSNAIKFTRQGRVELLCRLENSDSGGCHLRMAVADTGIGMSAEDVGRLFTPFVQVGGGGHRPKGTGLGLVICKRLVELMGGDIRVRSRLGVGTTVEVALTLPRAPAVDQPRDFCVPADAVFDLDILIVDDHPANLILLESQLERLGCRVAKAGSASEAMLLYERGVFAVVITDYSMPEISGPELARMIRQHEGDAGKPAAFIVGFTAFKHGEVEAACREAGMDACLSKPVGIHDWAALLGRSFPAGRQQGLPKVASPVDLARNPAFIASLKEEDAKDWQTVTQAMASRDWPALKAALHKMKGPFRLLDASEVDDLFLEAEDLCEESEEEFLREALSRLRQTLDAFYAEH